MNKNKVKSPVIAKWILTRLKKYGQDHSILGDVEEIYDGLHQSQGYLKAYLWYWKQTFFALPLYFSNSIGWHSIMFKNYLKITFRNLVRQKMYSLISIIGLSVGITCSLLIMIYINQELNYDQFHEKANRIYRLGVETRRPKSHTSTVVTPFPVAPAFKMDYPEIESITRIYFAPKDLIQYREKKFIEEKVIFAEPDFFRMFSFPLIKGKAADLLKNPNDIVLTTQVAKKYFAGIDPIGKVITYKNKYNFTVVGVMENVPVNSHFHFDFVASFSSLNKEMLGFSLDQWGLFTHLYTYVLLPEQLNVGDFSKKIKSFIKRYYQKPNETRELFMQSLTSIHLYSHMGSEIEKPNSRSNLIILFIIAVLILIIACINYVNLAVAFSSKRAKEVGIRKVLGANRFKLMSQFMGESLLLTFLAMILSLILVEMLLPVFSSIIGRQVEFIYAKDLMFFTTVFLLTIIIGVLSSMYPALILSNFKPIKILKGLTDSPKSTPLQVFSRQGLIAIQFAISILLIIGTLIVNKQLGFLRTTNLGFEKEQIIVLPFLTDLEIKKLKIMQTEIASNHNIVDSSTCLLPPISKDSLSTSVFPEGRKAGPKFYSNINSVDDNFVNLCNLKIIAGRNFPREIKSDYSTAFLLNQTILHKLGYSSPEAALGKKLLIGANDIEGTIIGIINDFHITSLHDKIEPLILLYYPDWIGRLLIKIRADNISQTLSFLERTWQKHIPDYPFRFSFLDEDINRLYLAEKQTFEIVGTFSAIAIIIACLGLFGLATFTAQKRTKEIGIRKVLGASPLKIVFLLFKQFTKWVLIANLIAWPVGYFVMYNWLQSFAYRIDMGIFPFIQAAVLVFIIALFTVSFQALRSSFTNPVNTLKYE
jgi:putative ABC transport system permease protein